MLRFQSYWRPIRKSR